MGLGRADAHDRGACHDRAITLRVVQRSRAAVIRSMTWHSLMLSQGAQDRARLQTLL
jgi:hypothetical protein